MERHSSASWSGIQHVSEIMTKVTRVPHLGQISSFPNVLGKETQEGMKLVKGQWGGGGAVTTVSAHELNEEGLLQGQPPHCRKGPAGQPSALLPKVKCACQLVFSERKGQKCSSVVKHLPCMPKALGLIPSSKNIKKTTKIIPELFYRKAGRETAMAERWLETWGSAGL